MAAGEEAGSESYLLLFFTVPVLWEPRAARAQRGEGGRFSESGRLGTPSGAGRTRSSVLLADGVERNDDVGLFRVSAHSLHCFTKAPFTTQWSPVPVDGDPCSCVQRPSRSGQAYLSLLPTPRLYCSRAWLPRHRRSRRPEADFIIKQEGSFRRRGEAVRGGSSRSPRRLSVASQARFVGVLSPPGSRGGSGASRPA